MQLLATLYQPIYIVYIYLFVTALVTVNIFMKTFMAAAASTAAAAIAVAELQMSKNSQGYKTFNSARILISAYLYIYM